MAQHQPSNQPHDFTGGLSRREAGDFTTDRRVLLLVGMSIIVGTAGAFAAWCLVSLIALVTNVIWFGEIGIQPALWLPFRVRYGWCWFRRWAVSSSD